MSPRLRAIVALLILVPVPSLVAHIATGVAPGPVGVAAMLLGKVWILLLPLAWWRWIEHERWTVQRPGRAGLGVGAVVGLVSALVIFAAYWLVGDSRIPVAELRAIAGKNGWTNPTIYLLFAAAYSFGNALLEEYVWRWFVARQWVRALHPGSQPGRVVMVAAALLAALCFTWHHTVLLHHQVGAALALIGSVGVFVGGAAWSWLYARYGTIWPGYVAHVCADLAIFAIGWRLLHVAS